MLKGVIVKTGEVITLTPGTVVEVETISEPNRNGIMRQIGRDVYVQPDGGGEVVRVSLWRPCTHRSPSKFYIARGRKGGVLQLHPCGSRKLFLDDQVLIAPTTNPWASVLVLPERRKAPREVPVDKAEIPVSAALQQAPVVPQVETTQKDWWEEQI